MTLLMLILLAIFATFVAAFGLYTTGRVHGYRENRMLTDKDLIAGEEINVLAITKPVSGVRYAIVKTSRSHEVQTLETRKELVLGINRIQKMVLIGDQFVLLGSIS